MNLVEDKAYLNKLINNTHTHTYTHTLINKTSALNLCLPPYLFITEGDDFIHPTNL